MKPSETRRAHRASLASQGEGAYCTGYRGNKTSAYLKKVSILDISYVEQEMIIFIHIIDIRNDTTRPDPNALSTLISQKLPSVRKKN